MNPETSAIINSIVSMPTGTLGEKQRKFTLMVALLIAWAYDSGYQLTFGDAYSKSVYRNEEGKMPHMSNSLHYDRLAIDLNLFKDGKYLTATEDHLPLGTFWESIGGSWGGRWKDGNHYSLAHEGRR